MEAAVGAEVEAEAGVGSPREVVVMEEGEVGEEGRDMGGGGMVGVVEGIVGAEVFGAVVAE